MSKPSMFSLIFTTMLICFYLHGKQQYDKLKYLIKPTEPFLKDVIFISLWTFHLTFIYLLVFTNNFLIYSIFFNFSQKYQSPLCKISNLCFVHWSPLTNFKLQALYFTGYLYIYIYQRFAYHQVFPQIFFLEGMVLCLIANNLFFDQIHKI